MERPEGKKPVAVIGASGYVGARLVAFLLEKGYSVRAVSRSKESLMTRPWSIHSQVELVPTDVMDLPSLQSACQDCSVAFYLVHSLITTPRHFAAADSQGAENMIRAAEHAHLERIIYLGGLGEESADLSDHLRSRTQVGNILQSGSVPATLLRAAMIIGTGSASFEILRYLVEHLPIMTTPRWVQTLSQPIAIRNVLGYLAGCLENPQTLGQMYDIGGPEILSYRDLMNIYAQEAHLPRPIILPVPVLTPRLSSYWISLVTPIPAALARPLTEGLKSGDPGDPAGPDRLAPIPVYFCPDPDCVFSGARLPPARP
jgi:uncharacterized protein YbjT (DUF2867 family)